MNEKAREYRRAYRERQKAKGLCARCPELAVAGQTKCVKHRNRENALSAQRQRWNRAAGLYRVATSYLCAGFVIERGKVVACAPILRRKIAYWMTVAVRVGP